MKDRKVSFYLLALTLLTPIPTQTGQTKNDTMCALIGAAAICAGIYCIYNYFSETDEDALDCACEKIVKYKKQYQNMTRLLSLYANEKSITATQAAALADNPCEEFLTSLAIEKQEKVSTYISRLSKAVRDISSSYRNLKKRTAAQNDCALHSKMNSALIKIEVLYNELSTLEAFFTKNRNYFILYEQELALSETYSAEFKILADTYGNEFAQSNGIRHYVIAKSKTRNLPFPRVEYINRIDRDIQSLDENIQSAHNKYANRIASSYHYLQTLEAIRGYIVNDTLFEQERYRYQEDQREKQRLRIEQEKADAARKQAFAAEREARAQEERNRIELKKQLFGERKTINVIHHR